MILTTCAACAAPLAHNAPRCVRCKLRYCNATCQHDHWRRGHKQMCKKIHRGGNAEQYHADKKYKEAVAEAVEACAADVKGQTCYICTQALHWKTKEGLVRMCACRGTAGFVHVSCLAEQAKILFAEAKENNLDYKDLNSRWHRWDTCSLCDQYYHGVVSCALGWACWKTYLGRPEGDPILLSAMNMVSNGLEAVDRHGDRLGILEAILATQTRFISRVAAHSPTLLQKLERDIMITKENLAICYQKEEVGQAAKALPLLREIYARKGTSATATILGTATSLAICLLANQKYVEAREFLCERIPEARRSLGDEHLTTLTLRWKYAVALSQGPVSPGDLKDAIAILEDIAPIARRVLGPGYPDTEGIVETLELLRRTAKEVG